MQLAFVSASFNVVVAQRPMQDRGGQCRNKLGVEGANEGPESKGKRIPTPLCFQINFNDIPPNPCSNCCTRVSEVFVRFLTKPWTRNLR